MYYYTYSKIKDDDGDTYCVPCSREKVRRNNLEKYGVINTTQLDSVKNKIRETSFLNYGVSNPNKSKEVRSKIEKTNIERYGVPYSCINPEVSKKRAKTNIEKYGVEYPFQSKEIQDKISDKSIHCSKQQAHICNVYNAEINVNIGSYFVDGLIDGNLVFEYDGSGHDLPIKLGRVTEENFYIKESKRELYLINNGYKILRIQTKKDNVPSDEILMDVLNFAKKSFEQHDVIIFDSDNNIYMYR